MDQSPCKTEPLLHSARKTVHEKVFLIRKLYLFQEVCTPLSRHQAGKPVTGGKKVHVFPDFQIVIQTKFIRNVSKQILHLVPVAERIFSVDQDRTFIRIQESRDDADRCGLSGSVRSDKAVRRSLRNFHVESGERLKIAKFLFQSLYLQHQFSLPVTIRSGSA